MLTILIIFFSIIILGSVGMALVALLSKFVEVATGTEQYAIHGQKYTETLNDVMGLWLWAIFGKRRVGFVFLNYDTKKFTINVDKKNDNPVTVKDDDPQTWIVRREPRQVDHLRKRMERYLVGINLELGSPQPLQISLGIPLIFEAIDGARFVFFYNADFDNPYSLVIAAVRKRVATFGSYQTLIESGNFLNGLISDNELEEGLKEFGLRLAQIKVDRITTDRAIEIAARKKLVAELELSAAEIDALKIETLGNAEANVILAKAKAEIAGRMEALGHKLSAKEKADIMVGLMTAHALENTKVTNLTLAGSALGTIDLGQKN